MADNLSDKEYRQLLKEIMLSTQSKGEFEWAVSEIRKLNKKEAETFEASQYPSLKLTENQESKLRWFMFAYEAHSINDSIYIDEELDDISPNLWTQATTVGLPFIIEKNSRQGDDSAKRMQKRTLSQLVKKGIFEVNESFEDKEVPFTINVKLTPKAEKAVKDDIDDLRSLVAESFEAEIYDRQGNLRTVDDNFIEATNDKLQALHRLLEANRKQILATNNQDTKTRLREERYRIQDAMAQLREFIDDPINHDGGDFMVRLGAETFEADGGIQVAEGYNEWWDELDAIRNEYPPDKFFNRRLGNPKWEDVILEQLYKDGWTPRQALYTWKFYTGQAFAFRVKPDERQMELYEYKLKPQKCGNCGGIGHNRRSCSASRNDPDFDKDKADRNKDGKISDWERAVGNAVAKGIREHKEEKGAETFEAEQIQYDVMKGKFAKGHEYANYISLHDSYEEAEAVAKRERKKLEKDEAIFIVEESFDDETFEIDTTLLRSISKSPMIESFPDASKDSFGAETFEAKGDDKYYINNRPQWMPKLMKDSVENEEEGTYNRHDKGYVAGLFLKSVKDSRLNGILKQTNYQDSDVVGFIMPFDLITRKLAKDYEPLILKDNFGKSKKYLVINGTPYNYDIFNSMLMRLPPTTEVRISGKPKYPLMFEFKFLNEHYLMFLAPYVGDDFDASQHGDYAKEVMSKSGAGFGFKSPPLRKLGRTKEKCQRN